MSAPVAPALVPEQRRATAGAGYRAPTSRPRLLTGRMGTVSPRQAIAAAVLLALAVVLQPTLVGLVPLPLGGPTLPTVVLACLALRTGPSTGCLAGFATGLAADLVSDHVIGRLAMVLCLVGYLAGMLRLEAERSLLVPVAAVAGAGVLSSLLFAASGALVDDSRAAGATLGQAVAAAALYGVLLTPFVFPFIGWLFARLRPRRTGESER